LALLKQSAEPQRIGRPRKKRSTASRP
jgi:hypothetical protein